MHTQGQQAMAVCCLHPGALQKDWVLVSTLLELGFKGLPVRTETNLIPRPRVNRFRNGTYFSGAMLNDAETK